MSHKVHWLWILETTCCISFLHHSLGGKSSCMALTLFGQILKFFLPCNLRLLTLHFEDPTVTYLVKASLWSSMWSSFSAVTLHCFPIFYVSSTDPVIWSYSIIQSVIHCWHRTFFQNFHSHAFVMRTFRKYYISTRFAQLKTFHKHTKTSGTTNKKKKPLFPYKYLNIPIPSQSSYLPAYEDGTGRVFLNVSI